MRNPLPRTRLTVVLPGCLLLLGALDSLAQGQNAVLQQLTARADAQNAAAKGGISAANGGISKANQLRLSAAAAQQGPAAPQGAALGRGPALSSANQVQLIEAVKEKVQVDFQLRPGSPAYAQKLQEQLLDQKAKVFGIRRPAAPAPDLQHVVRQELAAMGSVTRDPTWQKNFFKWQTQVLKQENPLRVMGGETAGAVDFLDCVAVMPNLRDGSMCIGCTGTLIGKNVVLTAAHCIDDKCAGRVFIGSNSNVPDHGVFIPVKRSLKHPKYDPQSGFNDLAILILERDADVEVAALGAQGGKALVPVRALAGKTEIDGASYVEVVGFGVTTLSLKQFGVKTKAQLPIASPSCADAGAGKYGCNGGFELVAGGNGLDSCDGDSGGPAYVLVGNVYKLAGVTSRATNNRVNICGDGGIYTRVDAYAQDWIIPTARANGGRMP